MYMPAFQMFCAYRFLWIISVVLIPMYRSSPRLFCSALLPASSQVSEEVAVAFRRSGVLASAAMHACGLSNRTNGGAGPDHEHSCQSVPSSKVDNSGESSGGSSGGSSDSSQETNCFTCSEGGHCADTGRSGGTSMRQCARLATAALSWAQQVVPFVLSLCAALVLCMCCLVV